MDYAMLFSIMGTALLYFIYKTHILSMEKERLRDTLIGLAIGQVVAKVDPKTKRIDLTWKEAE